MGRWPPVYDPQDVKHAIDVLASGVVDATRFYGPIDEVSGAVCQGDVLRFSSALPAIDEEGDVSVSEVVDHWFVTGNTCDYDRPIDEVPWCIVSPVYGLSAATSERSLNDLKAYRLSRAFYLPRWPGSPSEALGFSVDLTKVAMLHRSLVMKPLQVPPVRWRLFGKGRPRPRVEVVARLSKEAWLLLNAVFVRFIARDDGRYDAGR